LFFCDLFTPTTSNAFDLKINVFLGSRHHQQVCTLGGEMPLVGRVARQCQQDGFLLDQCSYFPLPSPFVFTRALYIVPKIFTLVPALSNKMTSSLQAIPEGSWILAIGANGFITSHIILEFLKLGYKVAVPSANLRFSVADRRTLPILHSELLIRTYHFPGYGCRERIQRYH
jgi:hypothetical protein